MSTNLPARAARTSYKRVLADGIQIFYREAGAPNAPAVLLLHGFPSSSHQYRNLIPLLATKYHVIAPDLPGFGFTELTAERKYAYTFANIANTIDAFTEVLGLHKYAIYVFDYGAPTGFQLATRHPQRITAVVSQSGNAYLEGLGEFWAPIRRYWADPSSENREVVRAALLTITATKWQYETGANDLTAVAPEAYFLDQALMDRPGNKEIQLDLFLDYANNLPLYPGFQQYFRESQVPLLAIWGKHDQIFIPPGAEAFSRDLPGATVILLDAGHFALETHVDEIASEIHKLLAKAVVA